MAKLYNQKTVAVNKASVGNVNTQKFTYMGFNSSNKKLGFKQYDVDLVKQDLINHFHIRRGQKLENPEYGTVIWDMIYEPMTEENKKILADDVTTIINSDPRMAATSVSVDATDQGIRIQVEMIYLPFNVTETMTLDFDRRDVAK